MKEDITEQSQMMTENQIKHIENNAKNKTLWNPNV